MYKVYLLQSLQNPGKSYVGLTTKEIAQRLLEHNNGFTQSSKHDAPWKVVYYEQFYCKLCADKREQFFKSGIGYRLRKLILEHQSELKVSSALQNGE